MIRFLASAAIVAFALSLPANADEDAIKLKPGDGFEAVEQNCTACHSLDYVPMNSPFLDQKGWTAEVTKMVKTFGAPVEEADQQKIIEYLTANYGKP
jgi:sulfite dehydrogenase (cytochrome) subunit B